jgi:hypothetical protein
MVLQLLPIRALHNTTLSGLAARSANTYTICMATDAWSKKLWLLDHVRVPMRVYHINVTGGAVTPWPRHGERFRT